MRILRQWGWFAVGLASVLAIAGLSGKALYRSVVPEWRRVEIDWTDGYSKAMFLGSCVRDAEYVILGDSVALRGINAGCFEDRLGPAINMGLSSANFASHYAIVQSLRRMNANTNAQDALVVVYQDMFRPWSPERENGGERLPTTFRGVLHLLRYSAASWTLAWQRWSRNLMDASLYRLFPKPAQVTALREATLRQLPDPDTNPSLFDTEQAEFCDCDSEILPYHYRTWWVENRRCSSGSEPSFPTRSAALGYGYYHLNAPDGIPSEYPYVGLADVLSFLKDQFHEVWLIVFPDRYGYADLSGFNNAMILAAAQAGTRIILLTDIDVARLFYDEHHALPEGMMLLTDTIIERMEEALL